jgi:hypothetical protein
MRFNEKFNLLMKMSNTTNTLLANAINVDPSLVSRWRTGSREPGDNSRFIQQIGTYFASRARHDFQRVALLELTGHSLEDKHVEESVIAAHLSRWLSNESKISTESIQRLLDTIGSLEKPGNHKKSTISLPLEPNGLPLESQVFFGDNGLQAAVTKLLLKALQLPSGGKLRLYSDEGMNWMLANPEFTLLWSHLLSECIGHGITIEIIHTLNRDSEELSAAVQKWLPFYFTGAITSHYYPNKRDGLFHHTSFTLVDQATVFSTSVKGQDREAVPYFYSTNHQIINSNQKAFMAKIELCKPLVRTLTDDAISLYLDQQAGFFSKATGTGCGMQSLSILGMSSSLLKKILNRTDLTSQEQALAITCQEEREKHFSNYIHNHAFKLVISLPRITDAIKGKAHALVPELLSNQNCYFQPPELIEQINQSIQLLKKHHKLEIYILPNKHMQQHVQTFAVHGAGMMVLKHKNPKFAFISEQNDLASATENHIFQEMSRIPKRERQRQYVIEKLQAYAQKIQLGMAEREAKKKGTK